MAVSTITVKELHGAVGAAVRTAVEKHKVALQSQIAIGPGVLVGPLLRPDRVTVEIAQQIAEEITAVAAKSLNANVGASAAPAGGQTSDALKLPTLQAGVVFSRGHILCGFWPPIPVIDVTGEI